MDFFVFVLELLGTAAFAASGALLAGQKKMDIFGICTMGVISACGGGVLRDVLLGQLPPAMFRSPIYAAVALGISLLLFPQPVHRFLARKEHLYDRAMFFADSAGLGIFTIVGVATAIKQGYADNLFFTVFLGVITGVGGGVLRDVLAGVPPFIFVKHIYACASLVGAILYALLWDPLGETPAGILCGCIIFLIRFLAARYHWNLPTAEFDKDGNML